MSRANTVYLVGFAAVWFALIAGSALVQAEKANDLGTSTRAAVALIVLLFALLPASAAASTPYKATLSEHGECEIKSLVRRVRFRASAIRKIEWDDEGEIRIRHDRGKARIVADHGFRGFLLGLFELNPYIEADDGVRRILGISPN